MIWLLPLGSNGNTESRKARSGWTMVCSDGSNSCSLIVLPRGLQSVEQVVNEGEPENYWREQTEYRHVRQQRQLQAEQVQAAAPLAEDPRHLGRVGMLGKGVIAQEPLIAPAEDRHRDQGPQRRQQPERQGKDAKAEHPEKRDQAGPPAPRDPAAAAPLQIPERTARHMIDHRLPAEDAEDE